MNEIIKFKQQNIKYNVNSIAAITGTYDIISEQTKTSVNNNLLVFGNSYLLSLDNSKNILNNNNFYTKKINFTISPKEIDLNLNINGNNYDLPYSRPELSGNVFFEKEYNNLINYKQNTFYLSQPFNLQIISDEFPDSYRTLLTSDVYVLTGLLNISGSFNGFQEGQNVLGYTVTQNIIGKLFNETNNEYYIISSDNTDITQDLNIKNNQNTSYITNNIEGSLTYNDKQFYFAGLSGTTDKLHLSSKGAIYNFPTPSANITWYKYTSNITGCSELYFSSQLINNGDIIAWSNINNRVLSEVNNDKFNELRLKETLSQYTKIFNDTNNIIILIDNNSNISNINKYILHIPKNLYKRNIYILILNNSNNITNIEFNDCLNIEHFYNGKIFIKGLIFNSNTSKYEDNINGFTISNKYTGLYKPIFKLTNLEEITISNIKFKSILTPNNLNNLQFGNNSDANETYLTRLSDLDQFHITLLNIENVDDIQFDNCSFTNVYPRKILNINYLDNYTDNILKYPTQSLIFNKSSNLILHNCELLSSNIGIITYLNGQTTYTGTTKIDFPNISGDTYKSRY